MILEWDNPWTLTTPEGSLDFNSQMNIGTTPLGYYLLDPNACQAGVGLRVTRDNIAQADGEIIHRKFQTGYSLELHAQLWQDKETPACGGTLRKMGELLDLHLNSILNADGRIEWTPSGWPAGEPTPGVRMVDKVRLLGPSAGGSEGFNAVGQAIDQPLVTVTFALLSPLPYAEDLTQIESNITAGGTLYNAGNANFYPVMQIHGPFTSFTITNTSVTDENGNALSLVYDSTLPGAQTVNTGHYAEVDFFRNTIYLDGHFTNLKAGIDVTLSDFFPLVPGDNVLTVGGGYGGTEIDVLWQSAYV